MELGARAVGRTAGDAGAAFIAGAGANTLQVPGKRAERVADRGAGLTDYMRPVVSIPKVYPAAERNRGSPRPVIFGELYQ